MESIVRPAQSAVVSGRVWCCSLDASLACSGIFLLAGVWVSGRRSAIGVSHRAGAPEAHKTWGQTVARSRDGRARCDFGGRRAHWAVLVLGLQCGERGASQRQDHRGEDLLPCRRLSSCGSTELYCAWAPASEFLSTVLPTLLNSSSSASLACVAASASRLSAETGLPVTSEATSQESPDASLPNS